MVMVMVIVAPGLGVRWQCHEDVFVNAIPGLTHKVMPTLRTFCTSDLSEQLLLEVW